MKYYKIEDEYTGLTEFILNLPDTLYRTGQVIVDNRNVVKIMETGLGTVVVKSYKGMYFLNRLVYSLFRKSKAERSYINAGVLNQKGILTPPNVGWMDHYKFGLLEDSYYLSLYTPYKTLRQILHENLHDQSYKTALYGHLLNFVTKLHSLDVYHNDFSLTNLLVIPTEKGPEFSMVDLNRVRFQKVSFRKGLQNFHKLEISNEDMNYLIRAYATLADQPEDKAVEMFWADSQRAFYFRRLRKKLRKYTLTPIEKMWKEK